MIQTKTRIDQYIRQWKQRGYSDDIPDEMPDVLMRLGLAPSYKSIAFALLRNDITLKTLGFDGDNSDWYGYFKRIEIEERTKGIGYTMDMFK